jgi:amidase/aspartyl-tRNA(Asn)/glutamyl-tRNA(Gln) amidotransferase subunit A
MAKSKAQDAEDLSSAARRIATGRSSATEAIEASLEQASAPAHTFIRRFDAQARAVAAGVDAQRRSGAPLPPLAGLAVSIKDLFDVAGQPTTGGSKAMHDAPSAVADCPAVARLRAAGAALVGHTNLSEFAFSGVGINPHHGTPANPVTALIDAEPRIPGGSSSGAAVSVVIGAAWAALGSDTGGSIRIPAALQGLVGFKNTARLTPLAGAIPLSTSLDTACAITRSVRDAVLLHEVLAQRQVRLRGRTVSALHLAVPTTVMTDSLEPAVACAFDAALARLSAAGARIERIELPQIGEIGAIHSRGTLAAAESWAWHRQRLGTREAMYDPRVARRIRAGEAMSAADYIELLRGRADWIARVEHAIATFDALLSPTVPIVAPPIAPLVASDEAFFATNALLLRNPSVVNFLDGCALSLPCHEPGTMPVGLMVWAGALADDTVLDVSLAIEHALRQA